MDANDIKRLPNETMHLLMVTRTLLGTGMVQPMRPDRALRSLAALRRWGPTSAWAYASGAILYPQRTAIVDERGTLTFAEVDRRTNALAHELAKVGIGEDSRGGGHVSQPPRVHRGDGRVLEAGGGGALPEHRVRGTADQPM